MHSYSHWTLVILITPPTLVAVGWLIRALLLETRKGRVPALLYHHFTSSSDAAYLDSPNFHPSYFCTNGAFDEQMNYLAREGYTTISIDDFVAFQRDKQPLPPKPIILTFDDGFSSNYRYAFPILKKYRMTATNFMAVDPNCENFQKYASIDPPLTYNELKEMSEHGIAIESHSMTHPYLSVLPSEVVRWELKESKRRIEELIGKPVRHIAIPSGAYSRRVKRLVIEAAYEAAFCMLKGTNNRSSDSFALRRLVIGHDFTLDDFHRLLQPQGAFYLRLTSAVQNALLCLLGPRRLDALRDSLYRLGLGSALARGQSTYIVPSFGLLAILLVVVLALFFRTS